MKYVCLRTWGEENRQRNGFIKPNITNDFFIILFLEENTEQVWLDRASQISILKIFPVYDMIDYDESFMKTTL